MKAGEKVNILLVDDQPAKLLSYEVMLAGLGENLVKAGSAREAFERLLKIDVAVILVDVCMPDLDGFELARMIREHPRFQKTAIIFISAIQISEMDSLRGYDVGAVDYVPVPVVPEVLRAKVRVFAELYRKSRELESLNRELENRVSERTSELAATNARLMRSEQGRSLALAAGNMGSWQYDFLTGSWSIDEGQQRIFGVHADRCARNWRTDDLRGFFTDEEWQRLSEAGARLTPASNTIQSEVTILRNAGEKRYCLIAAAASFDRQHLITRVDGVTIDITEQREAERRQMLLAREVDHRARNALAIVQAVIRLTRDEQSTSAFKESVEGRVRALAKAHELLSQSRWQGGDILSLVREELAPYAAGKTQIHVDGPSIVLPPDRAQTVALILHELATNCAKYGALSDPSGQIEVRWSLSGGMLELRWIERMSREVELPARKGVGTRIIAASAAAIRGCEAKFDWRTVGLAFALSLPLKSADLAGFGEKDPTNIVRLHKGAVRRVLLVEDEPLTGMFMHDLLDELGYEVVGPVTNLEDALDAANTTTVEAALLDVNLRGAAVDPVARILRRREVPIALVTGYSGD
ncbi:MAG: response regulator, partial [Alphaproteobacteria bacterium]|nr:response regulator [Alphaproteobacteria bacterium]